MLVEKDSEVLVVIDQTITPALGLFGKRDMRENDVMAAN